MAFVVPMPGRELDTEKVIEFAIKKMTGFQIN